MTDTSTATTAPLDADLLIVAGTYERLLYGLACPMPTAATAPADDTTATANAASGANGTAETVTAAAAAALEPIFIYPAHHHCIKSLATNGRYLATGSTDEHVKLYDLRIRKEIGTLMHHSGTITSLAFFSRTHLLSASEDGTVAIIRTRDWEVLKTLVGHVGPVLAMSVHPSGKILLTVGKDKTIKCWDLTTAKCASTVRFQTVPEDVVWSPCGTRYAVAFEKSVVVHDMSDGLAVAKIDSPKSRINAVAFTKVEGEMQGDGPAAQALRQGVLVLGAEDRTVTVVSLNGDVVMRWLSGHGARIKDVATIMAAKRQTTVVATCATDGGIFVWDLKACYAALGRSDGGFAYSPVPAPQSASTVKEPPFTVLQVPSSATPAKIASFDAKCRLTCLSITTMDPKAMQSIAEGQAASALNAAAADGIESDFEDAAFGKGRVVVKMNGDGADEIDVDRTKVKKRFNGKAKKGSNKGVPAPAARGQHKVKKALSKKKGFGGHAGKPRPAKK